MQPAFLFEGVYGSNSDAGPVLTTLDDAKSKHVKVLFFSGGKDSFLSIRAIIKKYQEGNMDNLCLVLLTTFDAKSRFIAHQDIPIDTIVRQATHLNVPLVGVPLHRGTSESYIERISTALDLVAKRAGLGSKSDITSLIFGDLHLEHIRGWRDDELGKLGISLEYPLWKVPYESLLKDLKMASVEVSVSAVTKGFVKCGEHFDEALMERARKENADAFGENGEFHTVVKVWTASRECALGINSDAILPIL